MFRTPGYGIWSKRPAKLELGDRTYALEVGQVEVIDLPAGTHHFKVRPEEGGLDFCDIKVSIDASNSETPAYIEVFERYNPTGQMLSMVIAEIEATTKYPLEPGQVCYGRFGLVQGVLPLGTDLNAPVTAQRETWNLKSHRIHGFRSFSSTNFIYTSFFFVRGLNFRFIRILLRKLRIFRGRVVRIAAMIQRSHNLRDGEDTQILRLVACESSWSGRRCPRGESGF